MESTHTRLGNESTFAFSILGGASPIDCFNCYSPDWRNDLSSCFRKIIKCAFARRRKKIPAMYFVVMFECCSIFILMHLVGHLLFIADRCHICFACHFQTVHPIPVIFISISTEITSPFQWHSWISKFRRGSIIPCQILHMHHISHPA